MLYWNQRTCQKTATIDRDGVNVAAIYSAPGYSRFTAFEAKCDLADGDFVALPNVISDSEDEGKEQSETQSREWFSASQRAPDISEERDSNLTTDFNLDGPKGKDKPTVIIDEEDKQETSVEAEFLRQHHRLGHISPKKIRMMARMGILPRRLATCNIPMCTACLYGKATRRPWRQKAATKRIDPTGIVTKPGDCVSVDQLESITPGLIAQLKGTPTHSRYHAATVFVDHHSRLGFVYLQKSTTAEETLQAKVAFEVFAASHGVKIYHYHADNGRFAENLWIDACKQGGQTLSFCGVNAHFQNGVAERRIRELQEHARTMLIHANRRWPEAIDAHLWPYPLRMANDLLNHTPLIKGGKVPIETFSGTKVTLNIMHWHSFGAPVYVLDAKMQQGQSAGSKWKERARVGIYLGQSAQHARTVALVLNINTGLTSPQFHVRVDESFETMRRSFGNFPPAIHWQSKCGFSLNEQGKPKRKVRMKPKASQKSTEPIIKEIPPLEVPKSLEGDSGLTQQPQGGQTQPQLQSQLQSERQQELPETDQEPTPISSSNVRPASKRSRKRPTRLIEAMMGILVNCYVAHEALAEPFDSFLAPQMGDPLMAMAATADPDTLYWHEAMKEPDSEKFKEAMQKEIDDHLQAGNMKLVSRSSIPEGVKTLPAVWSMKRKRRIATGEIYKYKSRLNLHGGKQVKGLHYEDSYAPVASWPTIRLVLLQALLQGWDTKQIDYVLAYTHAPISYPHTYMEIPRGCKVEGADSNEYVLHVTNNLYGGTDAGLTWFKFLKDKLESIGFQQSHYDDCLFYHGNNLYVLYTDDSILTGPDPKELEKIIEKMTRVGLRVTVEGNLSDFLGVKIDKENDGTIHMTQPHLIDQILSDVRLNGEGTSTKETPAKVGQVLGRDLNGEQFDGHFNYRSVIGKLNYLEKGSRPDISCAVHQCARFSADPRQSHARAVKWLGRYLLETRDKGMTYQPDRSSGFEVYVDASFAGEWDPGGDTDSDDSARSRSGFVIMYAGCPVVWTSKLQSMIALSTTEAEYIALSMALRETIPLMNIIKEMKERQFDVISTQPKVHCKVFEDNSGALEMAQNHKIRPRTKHINVMYHHFRSYVKSGEISIHACNTDDMRADILTKNVNSTILHRHRFAIMGW